MNELKTKYSKLLEYTNKFSDTPTVHDAVLTVNEIGNYFETEEIYRIKFAIILRALMKVFPEPTEHWLNTEGIEFRGFESEEDSARLAEAVWRVDHIKYMISRNREIDWELLKEDINVIKEFYGSETLKKSC